MTDNQRVDAQVERTGAGGIFRCQRVEHELEVWLSQRVALVELGAGTKQLCGRDRYLAIRQWQQVEVCRDASCCQHVCALLIFDVHLIECQVAQQPVFQASDTNAGTQFLGQYISCSLTQIFLYGRDAKGKNNQQV